MTFRLSDLNPQQREAVKIMNGPLLLLAGAGTGKTRVITYRIAYLVAQGVAPANILAVTFTNKAAREMKERLAALLTPEQAGPITASTFHSFCARILRARIRLLGYSSHFQIAADGYQVGLVRTIMSEMGSLREGFSARDCLNMISSAKSRLLLPGDINLSAEGWPSDLPEIYRRYQAQMKNMDMVDFDDLLLLVILLWRQFPDVLAEYQERCRYILIDEYQDTNPVQFQLVAMLAEKHRNICAVGDDDQSIYGWRGADLANILRFEDHFPAARVIRLEQNYRSTNIILQAANGVIARNQERHGKNLWSGKGEGEKILVVQTADERSEAEFVADFVRDRRALRGGDYNQFAVLYRSNHQSRVFEEAFRQAHVPYRLVGSRSFYERKEIMDAVSYLCAVQNPRDDLNLLRILNVPPRGMGEKAVERLRELQHITGRPLQELMVDPDYLEPLPPATAAQLRDLHTVLATYRQRLTTDSRLAANIKSLFTETGYLDGFGRMYKPREDALRRRENVFEFLNAAADFEARFGSSARLQDFLEKFALMDDNDKVEEDDTDAVTLMTVHAAKGLEFPVVLVAGLEYGLFPHHQSIKERSLEEERRLFYVAATRAQEELALTYADKRRVKGEVVRRRVSPFIDEVPAEFTIVTDADHALKPASREAASDFLAQMRAMFSP